MTDRPPSKFIIRTSDRNTFRRCRQLWDYRSPIRRHLEYTPGIEPLDFGIAIHEGLDVYYDPKRWDDPSRDIVRYEAEHAFLKHLDVWRKRLQATGMWEPQKRRHLELSQLGLDMLQHYWKWAPENDKHWRPVKSEIEFEVPIPVPFELELALPKRFRKNAEGHLEVLADGGGWYVVYYQGRIDLISQLLSNGRYILIDHKTAAQFGQTEHLDLDTQCRSYAWALKKMLNIDISQIVYSELKKSVPKPPRILQSGSLSVAKNQGTTYELYMEKIKELNHDPNWYGDFIQWLKETPPQEYFRRIPVDYRPEMLEQTGLAICMEAIDMLNDPFIYPNPDRWNCNGCAFRTPCLIKQEGGDPEWHIENSGLYGTSVKVN